MLDAVVADGCFYTIVYAPREKHDDLVLDLVAPVVQEIRESPALDSLFFVRYSEPRWQFRFRVLGEPRWVDDTVRGLIVPRVEALHERAAIEGYEFDRYAREIERYGGPEGMSLAEKLFLHDSLACLEFIQAERQGLTRRSRREFALLVTDMLVDLAGLDDAERVTFYRYGYDWTLQTRSWEDEELRILSERYESIRPGLRELTFGATRTSREARWGGETAAAIAERFESAARPVIQAIRDGLSAGRITQDVYHLFWSYAHMFTNRLGIDATAEAILRYFMSRLWDERVHGTL
jgi:thiopeptide-type bacteriocin biosynthesis protein